MTDQYTYPASVSTHPGTPGVQAPPLPPFPYSYPAPPPRKGKGRVVAALIAGAAAIALTAGAVGGLIGNRMAGTSTATPPQPTATTSAPTAEQVRAATIDLCTRFAAGYRAMPSPQNTGFDVLPTANYISDALRDNPDADASIRDAVATSMDLLRQHASAASGEPPRGAIQPPTAWTVTTANEADQKVWDLCRAYGG